MRMTFQREDGALVEAVLLTANRFQMRIVPVGVGDTVELTMDDGCWRDERGRRMQIEAMLATEGVDTLAILADFYPRTAVAGALS